MKSWLLRKRQVKQKAKPIYQYRSFLHYLFGGFLGVLVFWKPVALALLGSLFALYEILDEWHSKDNSALDVIEVLIGAVIAIGVMLILRR